MKNKEIEEILNKYIELIEEGYCSDCNELNCIDNFPHKKIVQEIKKIQQENQQLKKQKDDVVKFVNEYIQEDYYEKLDEYITHFTWNTTKEDLLRMLGEEE